MRKRGRVLFLVVLMLSFALTACGNNTANNVGKNGQKLEEVNLILDWYPNAIHEFIYAAIQNGDYEAEGLKVNIVFPANSTDPLTLTAADKATIGMYYQPDIIMARANDNIPIKSIGAIVHSPLNVVIALQEKGINSPKDLSGKTIGYSGNSLNTEYVKTMIKADGGNADNIKIVDVGFELLSAMTTKKVDATTGGLVNHEVPVMQHEGQKINYFDPSKYGVPNYYEEVFVASDKTIKTKPEILKKFLRASQKGFEYMKANPDKALKILLDHQEKDNFPLIEAVEKQSTGILIPKMESKEEAFLSQDKKVWSDNIDWLKSKGMIKDKVNAEDCYVNLN